jgi:hypothetical protein
VTGSATLNVARHDHKATLLPDGRVLLQGGVDAAGETPVGADAFVPGAQMFVRESGVLIPEALRMAPDACPVSQFTEWSCTYVREISSAHAIFAATEIARAIRHDPSRHLNMRPLSLRFNHAAEEELRQSFKLLLGVSIREYQTRQRILCALRGLRTGIKELTLSHWTQASNARTSFPLFPSDHRLHASGAASTAGDFHGRGARITCASTHQGTGHPLHEACPPN